MQLAKGARADHNKADDELEASDNHKGDGDDDGDADDGDADDDNGFIYFNYV